MKARCSADFTCTDDLVECVIRMIDKIAEPVPKFDPANTDQATSYAPCKGVYICNNEPVRLMEFIETI